MTRATVFRACTATWLATLTLLGTAACRRSRVLVSDEPPLPAAPVATAAPSTPVDHLAPDELLEGPDEVFGLRLPAGVRVQQSFSDVAYARGSVGMHRVAKYLRARLRDGNLREEDSSATFEHVHVPGKPGLDLTIGLTAVRDGVRLQVRDTTPPVLPSLPNDEARWRAVGLAPDGRWLHPLSPN